MKPKQNQLTLNQKLTAIQCELKVKKTSYNSFGKYYFRTSESILEAIKPLLIKHDVSVTITEQLIASETFPILECTATITDGTVTIHASSIVGVDMAQKGMQMPQRFGACSSYGRKYALGGLFLLDDTADSDATNDHTHGKESVNSKQWLTKGNAQWDKALEYMKSNGSITAIKEKYMLSKENEAELLKAK